MVKMLPHPGEFMTGTLVEVGENQPHDCPLRVISVTSQSLPQVSFIHLHPRRGGNRQKSGQAICIFSQSGRDGVKLEPAMGLPFSHTELLPPSVSGVLLDLEAALHTRKVPSGLWMLTHYGRTGMLGYSEPWDSHFQPCKF